jgi:plasmid maintenance system antidote protein VapI
MPTVELASQGELITQRLVETGMSVSAFARELAVRPSFIHVVRTGKRRLTKPATVERAASILGVSSDRLYLAIDRQPPDVLRLTQKHPILLDAVRKLGAKLDAQEVQHGSNR